MSQLKIWKEIPILIYQQCSEYKYFIFGMHTQLMQPFQMTPKSMALLP